MITKGLNHCPCCENAMEEHQACCFCGHYLSLNSSNINYEELQDRNHDQKLLERKVRERFDFISRYIDHTSSIIEVGCAEGALLKKIKENCPAVSLCGVEPSLDRFRTVSSVEGAKIYPSLGAIPEEEKFDLVLSFHVLEHIRDIAGILDEIKNYLKDESIIILEVPNFSGHPLVQFDNNIEHFHQFTPVSLISLLQRTKYKVLSLTTELFESVSYPDSIRVVATTQPGRESIRENFISRIHSKIQGNFYCYGGGGDFEKFILPFEDQLKFSGVLTTDLTDSKSFQKYDPEIHLSSSILISSLKYENEIFEHLLAVGHCPRLVHKLSDFL